MLNLFAAMGHINYAKNAQLNLQQMVALQQKNPWHHQKFQLVIEQALMRSIKTRGGLTRGRGMKDDVRNLWVLSLNSSAFIYEAMTGVSGLTVKANEQQVEMGASRCSEDYTYCKIFIDWLQQRYPFVYEDTNLHSLSFGLMSDENDCINCEIAEKIGEMKQAKLDNLSVVECTIKRKDQVKPIISLQSKVQLNKESVIVNPPMLFTRLVSIAQRKKEDIEEFFAFELTQEPMSLFKHGLMRKPDKSSLRKAVMNDDKAVEKNQMQIDPFFVVDGEAPTDSMQKHRVR
ncbi:uncharacterized protein LOC130645457 [Hydractinia symbiolongicarpus]|uniref:uncharacterized protein LOC130645457 n=1 Tax=Hydractinia symbiolongicarpus TaxID=13093 RepID=UPI0025507111|nr:uncharacterized protein LOC130645457 [Hydractinia symbiolongicarpus]